MEEREEGSQGKLVLRENTVPVSFLFTYMYVHVQHWTCVCEKCSHYIFKKEWKWQIKKERGRTMAAATQSKLITKHSPHKHSLLRR